MLREATVKLTDKRSELPKDVVDCPYLEKLEITATNGTINVKDVARLWPRLQWLSIVNARPVHVEEIFALKELHYLKLKNCQLNELNLESIEVAPLGLLNLSGNNLKRFPPELCQLPFLENLDLSRNQLSELPTEFHQLVSLKRLNLDSNCFAQFPEVIQYLKKLGHLSLDENDFTQQAKQDIQHQFGLVIH